MKDLWSLVDSLTDHEKKACKRYLKKEFTGGESNERKLLDLIIKGKSREEAHKYFFPKQPFNHSSFRELCSQLHKRLKQFLINQYLQNNPIEQDRLFLKILEEKEGIQRIERELKQVKRNLGKDREGLRQHFYAYELSGLQYNLHRLKKEKFNPSYFKELDQNIDKLWLFEKLQLAIAHTQLIRKIGAESDIQPAFLKEILQELDTDSTFLEFPGIKLMRDIYLIQKGQLSPNPIQLGEELKEQQAFLSIELQQFLFDTITNFFIRQVGTTFQQTEILQAYQWYQWGLEQNFLYHNGFIDPSHYQNFILYSILLQKEKDAETLIENQTNFLRPEFQEPYSMLMKALSAYYKGDFSTVQYLYTLSFPSPYTEIRIRFLMIKARYDEHPQDPDNYDYALGQLHNINMRLRGAKNIGEGQKRALNRRRKKFLEFVKASDLKEREELLEKINQEGPTLDTDWFHKHLDNGSIS